MTTSVISSIYKRIMSSKCADRSINNKDPDQTASIEEQSNLGQRFLPRSICPKLRICKEDVESI